MKLWKPILLAGLAVGIVSLQVALLAGPQAEESDSTVDQTQAARPGIALLDVAHVFKNHAGFKEEMRKMKADADVEQAKMTAERDELKEMEKMLERLEKPPRESKEAKELKEKITEITTRLQADLKRHQYSFRVREGEIFHSTYGEMVQEVRDYAQQRGFSLVLKHGVPEVDPDKPESVIPHVNQRVVWHSADVEDITEVILRRLNKKAESKELVSSP